MLYYSYTVSIKENAEFVSKSRNDRAFCESVNTNVQRVNEKQAYNVRFFVTGLKTESVNIVGVVGSKNKDNPDELAFHFIEALGWEPVSVKGREITIKEFAKLIHLADRECFIDDEDDVLMRAAVGPIGVCLSDEFTESFAELREGKTIEEEVKSVHCGISLDNEIQRINDSAAPREFIGHPVHYIIYSDNRESGLQIARILVNMLYSAGRLKSKRTIYIKNLKSSSGISTFIDDVDEPSFNKDRVMQLYNHQGGCTVITNPGNLGIESDVVMEGSADVEDVAEVIRQYHLDTLSILIFRKNEKVVAEKLRWTLPDIKFVEIEEEVFFKDEARKILIEKAENDKFASYVTLLEMLGNDDKGYYLSDVDEIYNKWLTDRLPCEVYPRYRTISVPLKKVGVPKGSAYDRLQALIGLKSAKQTIKKVVDYTKVMKLYKENGFETKGMSKHMIFTGNPGTAKTTVARLFAQIMKDNGVLAKGNLIEVGRQDLVGRYVGWTAKHVEEAFKKAEGSVLFIDEAYSLCDGDRKTFGTEAINTIVQLMENHRDKTIVIFAGYPDKMKSFLNENPGLRSRIAFHVNFDDYSEEELVEILRLQASDNGIELSNGVEERALELVKPVMGSVDFGQGRFVRNLFEQARMNQASRIMEMDPSDITPDILKTLIPEDFSLEDSEKKNTMRPIGFAL